METRTKTEYRFFILHLSDVRGGVDKATALAVFDDIEKLKSYYNSNLAEAPWSDEPSPDFYGNTHSYSKVFRKGSPLEWYNPVRSFNVVSSYDAVEGGVTESWGEDDYLTQNGWTIDFNPSL